MTFDILGGVFRKSVALDSTLLSPDFETEELSTAKTSTNLAPPTPALQEETLSAKPFKIGASFTFSGMGGSGRLTLSASGTGEDRGGIRHFSPLILRFLFYKYAFENSCLGTVRLHGEVQCTAEGDYNLETKTFVGKVRCQHGPFTKPAPVLYITQNRDFEIGLDAALTINGDPFNFRSYTREGKIIIDGFEEKIEELFSEGATCS